MINFNLVQNDSFIAIQFIKVKIKNFYLYEPMSHYQVQLSTVNNFVICFDLILDSEFIKSIPKINVLNAYLILLVKMVRFI